MGRKNEDGSADRAGNKRYLHDQGFGSHRAGCGAATIIGLGSGAGFTMMLQDRQGNSPQYPAAQAQKFIAAASQRPEIGRVYTLYRANVPQKAIQVDKDKVDKLGLQLNDVNTTISTMLGGAFINNFNQFGRQYKTYVMADQQYRMTPDGLQQFLYGMPKEKWCLQERWPR